MRPLHAHRRTHRRGNAAIEFALLVPVWIAAVAATMEFGWYIHQQTTFDTAVDVGCRAGSLVDPGEHDERIDLVKDRAQTKTREQLAALGGDCSACTFNLRIIDSYPDRTLVCDVTVPRSAGSSLILPVGTMQAHHLAVLEFQYE